MKRSFILIALFVAASSAEAQPPVLRAQLNNGQVYLSWTNTGAPQYAFYETTAYPNWQSLGTTTGTVAYPFVDPNSAKVFKVQPLDANGNPSGPASNNALVTFYSYTDDPLTVGATAKVQHITDLRSAINIARAAAGLPAATWSRALSTNLVIMGQDVADLRTALDAALQNIGITPPAYLDPILNSSVVVKRDHIQQLRIRTRAFPQTVNTSAVTVSNAYFSPNGDGVKDTTTFSAIVTSADFYTNPPFFHWQINVRNAGGVVLRSAWGSGYIPSFTWDGRDSAGTVQPEGSYTFELIDSDGIAAPIASATTSIDLTPPSVSITSPASGQFFSNVRQNGSGNVAVSGSATDAHLASWTLSVDGITAPVATGTTSTVQGTWNSLGTANGTYTIRLVGVDQGGNSGNTTVSVTLGHFTVSQNMYQLNTGNGGTVTYTSVVPFTLTEVLTIKSAATGNTVRTLVNASRNAGTYSDIWNGTNDAAIPLGDGQYRYTATVTETSTGASTTWDLSGQTIGSTETQYPYPKCMSPSNAIVDCNDPSLVFDPFTSKPLRIVYCVGGGTPISETQCSGSSDNLPYYVAVKVSFWPETTLSCSPSADCILYEAQSSGAHCVRWYGLSSDGSVDIGWAPSIAVIRRNDNWPRNVTLLYAGGPTITGATTSKVYFSPVAGTAGNALTYQVTLSFAPPRTATLTAQVRNLESHSILRTVTGTASTATTQSIAWDGRADNGDFVAPGEYEIIITASDQYGSTSTAVKPRIIVRY
jgi:flagellar hook assembly protein FlgD